MPKVTKRCNHRSWKGEVKYSQKGRIKMEMITVDQEKCIKCGACIKECPTFVLGMGKAGPEAVISEFCRVCGHCVAVCPHKAIDHLRTPLVHQAELKFPKLSAPEAEQFLRSRRSIRTYLKKAVPREELRRLADIAHFAPTGSNSQGVSYLIVDDRKTMDKAVEIVIEGLENDAALGRRFAPYIKLYREQGVDTVLRGAPSLVLAITDAAFTRGRENSILSLAYLELYAPALGLGSCWAGILEAFAFRDHSPLLELFRIPPGKKITGAVMVGYPQYSYTRLVDRNPLDVTFF